MNQLPVQIAGLYEIVVDDTDGSHTRCGEGGDGRAAEPAGADHQHPGIREFLLALWTPARERDLARVSGVDGIHLPILALRSTRTVPEQTVTQPRIECNKANANAEKNVTEFRVGEAAALLGVSDDTVRRWADAGKLTLSSGSNGRSLVNGVQLAALAQEIAAESALAAAFPTGRTSARNHITGIVTKVTMDLVMAQVEIQAGAFRVVSLMSAEAANELGLEVGTLAVASVKATNVVVELPSSSN